MASPPRDPAPPDMSQQPSSPSDVSESQTQPEDFCTQPSDDDDVLSIDSRGARDSPTVGHSDIPLSVHDMKPWHGRLTKRGRDSDIEYTLISEGQEMYRRMSRQWEEDLHFKWAKGVLGVAPARYVCNHCGFSPPQDLNLSEHWKLEHLAAVTFHGDQRVVQSGCMALSLGSRAYWRHKCFVQADLSRAMGDVQNRFPRCLQCVIGHPSTPVSKHAVAQWVTEWGGALE
eukprot:CAMPEP_0181309098 /NCGR_PEP_ID=MMETSP1101-20121128/11833_1 /TAXON_ID=46948 /ORGANISM="Rhodomonas abbreviata, Strain Caron Lab Isolate" /LENGTH=228 /DNA_ID=CAMNT_0023415561 /DNA_START=28 /DNA_END=714 /DNA_ORIENTATION=+